MSLHFALKVNGHGIYHAVDITRAHPQETPDPDDWCRYRVCAVREDGMKPAAQYRAEFTHRYGDGAFECIRKALNAIAEQNGGRIN